MNFMTIRICTGEEAAECRGCLSRRVESVGYHLVSDRGDAVEECAGQRMAEERALQER